MGKKAAVLASGRGGGTKGRGTFEELNTTIDAIVWFPELRTES